MPTRSAVSKGKAAAGPGRKGSKKESSSEKPQINGQPIENGVNGTEDIDMVDDGPDKFKSGNRREGEDEMTVVVPPPKGSTLSEDHGKDPEGDVDMENIEKSNDDKSNKEVVDPETKAVTGQFCSLLPFLKRC